MSWCQVDHWLQKITHSHGILLNARFSLFFLSDSILILCGMMLQMEQRDYDDN